MVVSRVLHASFWSLPTLHIQNDSQINAGMNMNFNFMNLLLSLNFIFGGFLTFGTTVRRTLSRTLVAKQKCNLRSTHSVVYAEGSSS